MPRIVSAALLVAVCMLPLARGTMLVSQHYGDSHDGRNGATWTAGSAALRDDPIESRLGAMRLDGSIYANHPPGLTVSLAVVETVTSPSPLAARALMIGSLWATIFLMYWLLVGLQFPRWVALAGTAALAATPMVRAYGSMVDTPIIALPVAVLTLGAFVRTGKGQPRLSSWGLIALGIGPLISWQLVWLDGLVCIALLLDPRRRQQAQSAVAAVAAGVTMLAASLVWVHGGLGAVVEQFLRRSSLDSATDAGLTAAVDYQASALPSLLGFGLIVIPFGVVRRNHMTRAIFWISLASIVGYAVILANGAANHDYWMYWLVLPVALGTACLVEAMWQLLTARGSSRVFRTSALLGLVFLPFALTYGYESDQEFSNESGAKAAELIASSDLAQGQVLWLLADIRPSDAWLERLDVEARHLTHQRLDDLQRAGRTDEVVLASSACSVPGLACDALPIPTEDRSEYPARRYAMLRVADLHKVE